MSRIPPRDTTQQNAFDKRDSREAEKNRCQVRMFGRRDGTSPKKKEIKKNLAGALLVRKDIQIERIAPLRLQVPARNDLTSHVLQRVMFNMAGDNGDEVAQTTDGLA
jgi:hypothetical protein